jgi:hypothetical protein
MTDQKGSATVVLLVVLVVVLAAVLVYFAFLKKPGEVAISPTPTPTKTATPTPSALVYANKDYNFQLTLTDAWLGYKVVKSQLINNSGTTYDFIIPTKMKNWENGDGKYTGFTILAMDKHADKYWENDGPQPTYLGSSQTMDFYVIYPQDIPDDLYGKIDTAKVVSTFKILK